MILNRPIPSRLASLLVAATIAALGAGNALAEKPDWAGGGKGNQQRATPPGQLQKADERRSKRSERTERKRPDRRQLRDDERRPQQARRDRDRDRRAPVVAIATGSYFNDGQRRLVHQWYGEQFRAGHCPPGLAKKNNGCMPPGQAKKWALGRALPAGVVYYPVPQAVVVELGVPPAGYQYVRVANDILLLAIGSRMVVDAITDLGHML